MNKKFYIIRTYDLVDVKLYTHEEILCDDVLETKKRYESDDFFIRIKVIINGEVQYFDSTNPNIQAISDKPMGYKYDENGLLPYNATVKEDLPSSLKKFAKTYPNCKLKMEKHGGYLQFLDESNSNPEENVHRIAINSNDYIPNN